MSLVPAVLALATTYQTASGVFFKHPVAESAWVEVADADGNCHVMQPEREDRNGVVLKDAERGRSVYLTNWGVLYVLDGSEWKVESRGAWTDERIKWQRYVATDTRHRMVWRSESFSFINDPRSTHDRGYQLPSSAWYRVEGNDCLALTAVERTYGAAGLQTVKVKVAGSLPLPAQPWSLQTGFGTFDGTEVPGNWLVD